MTEDQGYFIQKTRDILANIETIKLSNEPQAQEYILLLMDLLRFHNQKYYQEDAPLISDSEYDQLFHLLKYLENAFPHLIDKNSPTQKIAVKNSSTFAQVEHLVPMLSLENAYNSEDLIDFEKRAQRTLAEEISFEYIVEPKFDGIGIALLYENNKLIRGATRGDGSVGEDITENVKTVKNIPHTLTNSQNTLEKLEVRGEIVMPKEAFQRLNQKRTEEGKVPFANPRNSTGGSLRQLDASITASRDLQAFLYHISFLQGDLKIHTHEEAISKMEHWNLPHVENYKKCKNIQEVISYISFLETHRESFPYEIDGAVVKVNSLELQKRLGYTMHHPRWAIAYKFKALSQETVLKNITLQVGRTGAITPVAELEPISIGGVTVKRASLYNHDYIQANDLRIGDHVIVERAGDVIPRVVAPILEKRTGSEIIPNLETMQCPSCGTLVHHIPDEVIVRCTNINCPAQQEERIIHFASKDAMDIDGLGVRIIQILLEEKLIHTLTDLYLLYTRREDLLALDGFQEKSVDNLLRAIEASKKREAWRLLHGLGIRNVGKKTAKTLLSHPKVHLIKDIFLLTQEETLSLPDIGPILYESICNFNTPENQELLDTLMKFGVHMNVEKKNQIQGIFSDKTFVLTGELDHFSREEAGQEIEKRGGKTTESVSKNTTYVLVGKNPGSKLQKAQDLKVQILHETEFEALLNKEEKIEDAQKSLF